MEQFLAFPTLFLNTVKAGFPSPAEDFADKELDLNSYLVKHQSATFFVKVSGNSMINAGIFDGDILVVDRSLQPLNNNIVIAIVDKEFTVKRLKKFNRKVFLAPENPNYPIIEIKSESELEIWGVVTFVIHRTL